MLGGRCRNTGSKDRHESVTPCRNTTGHTRRLTLLGIAQRDAGWQRHGLFHQTLLTCRTCAAVSVTAGTGARGAAIIRDEVKVMSARAQAFSNRARARSASAVLPCATRLCHSPNSDQPVQRLRKQEFQ